MARSTEPLGWFQVAITFVISVYYAVVIAWALRYAFFSANLAWGDDPVGFFTGDFLQVAGEGVSLDFVGAVLWPLLLVWVVCVVILALGVQNGLEKANIIFLPTLVLLFGGLVVRALFLDGAAVGLNSLFTPRWDALGDPQVWLAAYSQIFFSLSVAFGIMITYSSYLRRRANLISTGYVAAFANSSFEILAGIGVFATLGFMSVQANTPIDELPLTGVGLSFMAFPQIISMMPGGALFGVLFFASLVVAGITSLISVLQVISAAVQEKFRLSRVTAALGVGGVAGGSRSCFSTTTACHAGRGRQVGQRDRRRRLGHRHDHPGRVAPADAASAPVAPQPGLVDPRRPVVAVRRGRPGTAGPRLHARLGCVDADHRRLRGLPALVPARLRLGRCRVHGRLRRDYDQDPVGQGP